VIGNAYFFSVNGPGWVQVPYNALLSPPTSDVTVTAWIKPTGDNPSGMAVVSNEGISGSGLYGYGLRVINGLTTLQWCWAATNGPGNCAYSTIPFNPLNVWTHIAGTYDGTTLKEYVNGVLVQATDNSPYQHPLDTNQPLMIGRLPDPTEVMAWRGGIEDVRVYNKTLSATDINLLTLTTTDQCKNGNWQTYGVFKSQRDCVSFVAADGTNPPAN